MAVESGADRLTYKNLIAQAVGLAQQLWRAGTRPGDVVAVAMPRSIDLIPALLGVQFSGAAYLPVDPHGPTERLAYILDDAGADVVVTGDPAVAPAVVGPVRIAMTQVRACPEPGIIPPLRPERPAYVIYTSGSTGRPKGVVVTHEALANFLESMLERPGLPDDVVLPAVTTVAFDIAVLELFLPLMTGGRVVIAEQEVAANPTRLAALLDRTRARVMQATPVTWRLLLEAGWKPPAGFTVLCGGERLPAELATQLLGYGVVLWDLYGPTETTVWSASTRYERGVAPQFQPVANTSLHILDGALRPARSDQPGELYIGGRGLARSYHHRAALTAERFIADPYAAVPGSRLYRTGDLARGSADGRIEILGRSDDQIKIRGFRIEPGEIEATLTRHPAVAQAAVRAVGEDGQPSRLIGYVRPLDTSRPPNPNDLEHHLAGSLPAYMVPGRFVLLDAFPVTPNGKLDRANLPIPPAVPSTGTDVHSSPTANPDDAEDALSTTEQDVAAILTATLQREVGPQDDFFALGGDSITAIKAVSRVNEVMGAQLPIAALFEVRTVYGLARLLDDQRTTDDPRLVPLGRAPSDRLSSDQWRIWLQEHATPRTTAFNVPLAVRLPDETDVASVQVALAAVLARNDILRTRYDVDHSRRPHAVVLPAGPVHLQVDDGNPAEELSAELGRPFDLLAEPPLRVRLVRDVSGGCTLIAVVHRIAADRRSVELIAEQLLNACNGILSKGRPLQYADYAEWRRTIESGPSAERDVDFWQTALDGLESAELPTDTPRRRSRVWRAATTRFTVDPGAVRALRDLTLLHDASLPIGLMTAFLAVMSQWVTGPDLTVGIPAPGRRRPELREVVGPCDSIAVLRWNRGRSDDPNTMLPAVRDAVAAVHAHGAAPFEDIVAAAIEAGASLREGNANPLFGTTFAVHPGCIDSLTGFPLAGPPDIDVDVEWQLVLGPEGGIGGQVRYASDLFAERTIRDLVQDYLSVLADMTRRLPMPPRSPWSHEMRAR